MSFALCSLISLNHRVKFVGSHRRANVVVVYHILFLKYFIGDTERPLLLGITTVGIPARKMGRQSERCLSTSRRCRRALVYGAQRSQGGMKSMELSGSKGRLNGTTILLRSKGQQQR